MKIDRLIIDGFGKLQNRQVRFAPDRVNLLVEENEFGKSTLAKAICAALYGFPRERTTPEKLTGIDSMRPLSGASYRVSLELSAKGRRYGVTRDFEDDSIQVIDLETRSDVKAEFIRKKGPPQIGEMLTGLSREQFQETSFIGHHSLVHHAAGTDLKRSFEQIASSSPDSKTAAQAISALRKGLDPLPGAMMGPRIKADTEISRLKAELSGIEIRLAHLDDNSRRHAGDIGRFVVLKQEIETRQKEKEELELLRLAAYGKELDTSVLEQEQYQKDVERLRHEREELVSFETFPAAINENLVRWLGQWNTRTAELWRIENEIAHTKEEVRKLTIQMEPRFSALTTLTSADNNKLSTAREQLRSVGADLTKAERSRQVERDALRNRGILPSRFDELNSKLSELEEPNREAAIGYPKRHEQLAAELERNERLATEQTRFIETVDAERKRRKRRALSLAAVGAILAVTFGVLALGLADTKVLWVILSALSFASSLLLLVVALRASVVKTDERSKATLDFGQATAAAEASYISLQELNTRLNSFAKSSGFKTADELASACLEHLGLAEKLREFQRLTDELNLLEQLKGNVQAEVFPTLQRAVSSLQDSGQVTQHVLTEICSELETYFDLRGQIKTVNDRLNREELEQQRAREDVDVLAERLRNSFHEAGVEAEGASLEEAYNLFKGKLESHQKLKKVDEDIDRLDRVAIPLPTLLTLKAQRESVAGELTEFGAAELIPEKTQAQYSGELVRVNSELGRLAEELSQVRLAISKVLGDYEREGEQLRERRDQLETQVSRVSSYCDAVSLALEKLESIATDVHREWSVSLNAICEEMLSTTDSNYRSIRFADDLSFSVETTQSGGPLTMRDITSRLSLGAQEQLFLLQRLAVSRFLSDTGKLPLILDDPLVSSDDDRFLGMMRFVIEALPEGHQVLMFSCHKRRHEWLREQLGDLFAERVNIVQLEPI
ncbi:MAG TPA: AAA family ATPase [Pyrinomonadaceae bacterium]|nr:AAA family ATPase [Pyrinomonadaceae bacterium]